MRPSSSRRSTLGDGHKPAASSPRLATPPQSRRPSAPSPSSSRSSILNVRPSSTPSRLATPSPSPARPPWSPLARASETSSPSLQHDGSESEEPTDDTTLLITESDRLADVDEEMQDALDRVADVHAERITHYKRLLSANDVNTASTLHRLHADISSLDEAVRREAAEANRWKAECEKLCGRPAATTNPLSSFDEATIRPWVRGLDGQQRLQLLHLILDACMPSDIRAMQVLLARYGRSSMDIVASLPPHLGARTLLELPVEDLLRCRLISKGWLRLIADEGSTIWPAHADRITASDPGRPSTPTEADGYERPYRGLHFRERNWAQGLVQEVHFLKGHTSFVTALKSHGDTLVSDAHSIRIWDLRSVGYLSLALAPGEELKQHSLAKEGVVAAGCHNFGRIHVLSTLTGASLQKLSGHNKGIKAVAMKGDYLVSAGMDKALVAWDWRTGRKIVRFGQQTNLCIGIALLDKGDKLVAVQVDGIVRTFDISTRLMLGQYNPQDLLQGHPAMTDWLSTLSGSSTNVFMWVACHSSHMTLATRDHLLYLEWPTLDLRKPPRLISFIPTSAETNDLSVGISSPAKRRVLTATRFATRAGTDRHIYVSHFPNGDERDEAELRPLRGAWSEMASIKDGVSPARRAGIDLAAPAMNPMAFAVDHERIVVGTTGGLIYTCSFVGYEHRP